MGVQEVGEEGCALSHGSGHNGGSGSGKGPLEEEAGPVSNLDVTGQPGSRLQLVEGKVARADEGVALAFTPW